jgi:peptidoglycan-associated lipoprotein
MKRLIAISIITLTLLASTGCKDKSTMPEEVVDTTPAVDTTPVVEETWDDVDTTDEVVFTEAELDAAFREKVELNMHTLYFEYNRSSLTPESLTKLETAAIFMNNEPTLRIRIDGHCDEKGTSDYNMALGEKRAVSVKEYFIKYGINPLRIEVTSFGKESPATFGCEDEACNSQNRRAEYTVLKH